MDVDVHSSGGGQPGSRSVLRGVAVPAEHGGWGLTLEPAVLGLLVAPSAAGLALASAALIAFVCRTPLKLALLDRWRHRRLPRSVVAERVAAIELLVFGALVVFAMRSAHDSFWVPVVVAAPLFALELWFDVRSRGRRLVPELAGAVGISGSAAMIVLADGGEAGLAAGLWLLLSARAVAAIPFVRAQIARLHNRSVSTAQLAGWHTAAVVSAATAVALDNRLLPGAAAVVMLVIVQLRGLTRPVPRVAVVGAQQMVLGFAVVFVAALGVLAS